jgi:pimeloyl-ACP methyl ester carboxylesterase
MTACTAAGVSAVCGVLQVPEDRSNPTGRQIGLRVAVIPALKGVPKADPLVPLDGGPGQAATEDLGWTASVFDGVHVDRDIVLVDQRGTGGSNRLVAPEAPDTTGLTESEAKATLDAWVRDVLAEMPGDPRFYTTSAAMDDLDDVRAALGYEMINLYGPSYGATAAQYYLRQHADHVRAVVLDGGTLLEVPIFERVAANSQHALEILFARCEADSPCSSAFPLVRSELATVLSRLATEPVTTSVPHPWTGDPIVVDASTFANAVHQALLDARFTGELPSVIHSAYLGDWDRVGTAISAALGPPSSNTDTLVMSLVIRCSEAWARFDPVETERASVGSYLSASQIAAAQDQVTRCEYVPKGVVPVNDRDARRSQVPVLLVLGEADPQNPAANVANALNDFPNSLTVIVPGQAHTVAHLGCMPSIVEAFIAAGTVNGLDVSCAKTSVPPPAFTTSP